MKRLKQVLILGISFTVVAGASSLIFFLIGEYLNFHFVLGLNALNSGQIGVLELWNIVKWMLYPFLMGLVGMIFVVSFLRDRMFYFLWEKL